MKQSKIELKSGDLINVNMFGQSYICLFINFKDLLTGSVMECVDNEGCMFFFQIEFSDIEILSRYDETLV